MKKSNRLFLMVSLIGILLITLFIVQSEMRVKAQDDLISSLTNTLLQEGVPLKDISILNRSPFQIEIAIQRSRSEKLWSSKDLWYDQLARREATLSYKKGHRLDSYVLSVYDIDGKLLDWGQTFLSPNRISQKPYPFINKEADDNKAENKAKELIELYGLTLDSLKVTSGIGSSTNVQLLKIQLSTDDVSLASKEIPDLVSSAHFLVPKINQEPGGRIAIIWLMIVDSKGKPLMVYLWDLELSCERGGSAEGITRWFSSPPASEGEIEFTPSPITTEYPTPIIQPYPDPSGQKIPPIKTPYP